VLFAFVWPTNVRELEQSLRRAAMLANDDVIRPEHLPQSVTAARRQTDPDDPHAALLRELKKQEGNVSAVARSLGNAATQIHPWIRRFGIDPNAFRTKAASGGP
jgi:transcriptional regulator of acetoin/glycerol metabolism